MKLINSAKFTAVIDANVLFPVVIRDYSIWLSIYELYTPKWSKKLLVELSQVFEKRGISSESAKRQINLMNAACPNALVDKYGAIISSINLMKMIDM